MGVISLTVVSINGKPVTPSAYGFETNDIVAPISNDGTYSTVVSRDIKGIDQQARSNAKYIYEVQENLAAISALSDQIFLADVTYRKGLAPQYAVNYQRVFPINIVSGIFIPVSGGTQFFVGEDGDPNLVFYQVSQTVAQIVAQTVTPGVYWGLSGNTVGSLKKIGTVDNFDFPIITNNAEVVRVSKTGNVGINTISPLSKLHIDTKLSRKTEIYRIQNIDVNILFYVSSIDPNGNINADPGDVCYVQTSAGAGAMYIKLSGIGTSTGWAKVADTSSTWILGGNTVTSLKNLGTVDNFDLPIITNNAEVARFTTSGDFGIGVSVPSAKLDVSGNANISQDLIVGTDLTVDTDTLYVDSSLNHVGIGNLSPVVKLDVYSHTANTIGVTKIENQVSSTVSFLSTASPETIITANPSDLCYVNDGVNGNLYIKNSGISTNTGWLEIPNSSLKGTPCEIQLAASDETTALTTGTAKVTFRMPYAMTLTEARASLTTAQASGLKFIADINQNGSSIFSTTISIDNTEKTSVTAVTPPVISTSSLIDDAEMTIDIDQIGDGTAKGLKITLKGVRA